MRTYIKAYMNLNFGQIPPLTTELAALECLKNGEDGVSTFSLLFLFGSFWYFHVTRTSIKAWMSSNVLKWDLTLAHWTQVSDRCPLGYLFFFFFFFFFFITEASVISPITDYMLGDIICKLFGLNLSYLGYHKVLFLVLCCSSRIRLFFANDCAILNILIDS